MKKLGWAFEVLLLLLNSMGILGALFDILGLRLDIVSSEEGIRFSGAEDGELSSLILFAGLTVLCAAVILIWRGTDKRKICFRLFLCIGVYVGLAVLFRRELEGGGFLAFRETVGDLNQRYGYQIPWQDGREILAKAGWDQQWDKVFGSLSVLFILLPLEILKGLFWKRDRGFCLVAEHVVWFSLACCLNTFPEITTIVLCIIGTVAALVQKDFAEAPAAGGRAVVETVVLAGVCMGICYRFLLPVLDEQYEETRQFREQFYRKVNDEWIPGIQNALSDVGPGVDVTGALNRTNVYSDNSSEMYRVIVDRIPQGALYLKGFVGGVYGEREWTAQKDKMLENYYRTNGLELPKDYGSLVNISYEAMERLRPEMDAEHIRIEELGGRGSYSVYPYGVLLTEEHRVHGDGTVEWESDVYDFQFRYLSGSGTNLELTGQWKQLEEAYRKYVYDTFLEYPEKSLSRLTECLSEAQIRTEDITVCVLDIMDFLGHQAVYNLGAEKNPAGTDFVEYFLFESHEGYCVHFASAAVLALRYFGIPARYATGYVVSPADFYRNIGGGYRAVVTGKQAHAWAEVYLNGVGWVPVEMTPGAVAFGEDNRREQLADLGFWHEEEMWESEEERETLLPELPEQREPSQMKEELTASQQEPNHKTEKEPIRPENIGGREEDLPTPEAEEQNQRMLLYVLGTVLLFISVYFVWGCLFRMGRRRWKDMLHRAGNGERIALLYGNLRKALKIAGCPRYLPVGGEELLQNILTICPEVERKEYETLCTILEKNTFGRTEPTGAELKTVWMLHNRLVGFSYAKVPFYKKWLFKIAGCYVS